MRKIPENLHESQRLVIAQKNKRHSHVINELASLRISSVTIAGLKFLSAYLQLHMVPYLVQLKP